jgi:hypothetical protein
MATAHASDLLDRLTQVLDPDDYLVLNAELGSMTEVDGVRGIVFDYHQVARRNKPD